MPSRHPAPARSLPPQLFSAIERAGYYPALVADVVAEALSSEDVVSHLVHQETTFDHDTIRRHITVLALTPTRLVLVHADDHSDDPNGVEDLATATSESIPLRFVRGVMLTDVVANPRDYRPGTLGRELTLTVGWGTVSRVDVMPATCGDPACDADHGYEGTIASDDLVMRISADADGRDSLSQARAFAGALSGAIGR